MDMIEEMLDKKIEDIGWTTDFTRLSLYLDDGNEYYIEIINGVLAIRKE